MVLFHVLVYKEIAMSQLKISSNDIPEGTGKIIKSEDKEIAIFNVNGECLSHFF